MADLFIIVSSAAADAEGGSEQGLLDANFLANITGIVVFLIAFTLLGIFVWPKIIKGLDDRNEKILSEIHSAEEAREQAKSALADYERELSRAREESSKMIADAKSQAKALAEELREKNEQELSERMARATADIESAKASAVSELHSEAAELASVMASKILAREINSQDQKQLLEESLAQLGRLN
ncbi:MAG: ATP synthase F0 subunit B [Planctomycetaceae bacterium]|nr:ATP synthase F0 subunit B [Planctomycetaceae bacterium]